MGRASNWWNESANQETCKTAIALVLTITNTLAFSRCDKFSQASNMAGSAFYGGNLAGNIASSMASRLFTFGRS
jgi:hypothetical protein